MITTVPQPELIEIFRSAGGKGTSCAEVPMCYAASEDKAREIAHRCHRWALAGGPVMLEFCRPADNDTADGDGQIGGEREHPDHIHQLGFRYGRGNCAMQGAAAHSKAEQSHDAAFEQRGPHPPLQGKTDDGERDGVIRSIPQKIESVGAQAHRAGKEARNDLDQEHLDIHAKRRPQNPAIAGGRVGACQ